MVEVLAEIFRESRKRKFLWAVLNQGILSIGAITIVILLSHFLTEHMFGEARFLVAVLTIFAFFSLPGFGPVILQKITTYSRESVWRAVITQLRWGSGAALGAFVFAAAYFIQGNQDLAQAFIVSGILTPVANLYLMPGTIYAGLKKFKEKTFCDGFIIACTALGAAYGVMYFQSVAATMFWYFFSQALATCIALFVVTRNLKNIDTQASTGDDTLYGKQLSIFQVLLVLMPALEKALVFVLLGPVALAVYVIAMLPIEHMLGAYRSLLQFFSLPHLESHGEHTVVLRYLRKISIGLGVISIGVVVVFALYLLPLFFPKYIESQQLILLSAAILIAFPAEMYILSLLSHRRIDYLLIYALITILSDILTFVIFMSLFGLPGTIIAKILAAFVRAIAAYTLYRRNNLLLQSEKGQ